MVTTTDELGSAPQRLVACHLCHSEAIVDRFGRHSLPLRRCRHCGLVFIDPQPDLSALDQFYDNDYFAGWNLREHGETVRRMKQRTFRDYLDRVADLTPGRLLEIGCATGFFLELAESLGWDVAGVELSREAAMTARTRFGDRVIHGRLEDAVFAAGSFRLVAMFDLLEHIPDPVAFLAQVARVLEPGGRVLMALPNVASLSARVMQHTWNHYQLEHLFYYSPETIRALLRGSGLHPMRIESSSKHLCLDYLIGYSRRYPNPILTPALRVLGLLPGRLRQRLFRTRSGEMLIVAEKSHD